MTKLSLNDYSETAGSNTDVDGVNIAENCSPANINNAIRSVMSHIAKVRTGTTSLTGWSVTNMEITGTATIGTLVVTTFSPTNISISGNLSVGTNATVAGTLAVTGAVTGGTFIPSSASAPTNGVYLAAANSPAIASNTTERLRFNASGAWGIAGANYGTAGYVLTSGGSGAAPSWASASTYNPSGTTTSPFKVALNINSAANTLELQAGSAVTGGGGIVDITFPTAFAVVPRVVATPNVAAGGGEPIFCHTEDATTTTVRIIMWDRFGSTKVGYTAHWMAFGKTA